MKNIFPPLTWLREEVQWPAFGAFVLFPLKFLLLKNFAHIDTLKELYHTHQCFTYI